MVKILGVPFSTLTFEETLRMLKEALRGDSPLHIITANPEIIMMAQKDPRIMELLHEADLVTPDGIGAVWASQYYGEKIEGRVTGIELSTALIEEAAAQGVGVFLLGTKPEINRQAVENLRRRYPGLRIAGHDGYFKPQEEEQIVAKIREFGPALLLVGLGMPRQEQFIHRYKHATGAKVMIGVGGCIDIWAGAVKRAPKLWQRMGLEWLYRLLTQPSRWRRQLVLPQFVLRVLTDKNRKKV
jgi:N-acetylglucosaminyldiphosphoundecaprenol N-acetyl-beta-D-mannosaminyltransferase